MALVSSPSSFICAGIIASAHGIKGHVKVKCFLEDPSHFQAYSPYSNEKGEPVYQVDKVLSQDKDVLTIALHNVTDRNQAEELRGAKLMLAEDRLPTLPDDIYYQKDLIGLNVQSSTGQPLGKVHAVHNFGAGDLVEVETLTKTRELVPFTHENVPQVNLKERTLTLSEDGEAFLSGGSDEA